MAKNEVFKRGEFVTLPVPAGTVSGGPVKVGLFMGVAQTDRTTDGTAQASISLVGTWNLTVNGAVSNIGDPVYIDAANVLSTTATGNTLFGAALKTKGAAAGVIPVHISQV